MFLRHIKNKFLYNFLFALRMDECSRVPYATCYTFTISVVFSYTLKWECSRWCVVCARYVLHPNSIEQTKMKKKSKHLVLPIFQRIIMNIFTIGTSLDFRSKSNWCCMHCTFAFNVEYIAFGTQKFFFSLCTMCTPFSRFVFLFLILILYFSTRAKRRKNAIRSPSHDGKKT